MAVTTARQRVLAYIRKEGSVSAAEIGRGLAMSAATVRHHLSLLLADGRISSDDAGGQEERGRGRPAKRYRLSDALQGNNLSTLSSLLLESGQLDLSSNKRDSFLRELAKGINRLMGEHPVNVPVAKRLAQTVEGLNRMYYGARWEAGPQGPRILFGHCPYAAVIRKHPELCRMDAFLLKETTGLSADQQAKIRSGPDGSNYCIFLMR